MLSLYGSTRLAKPLFSSVQGRFQSIRLARHYRVPAIAATRPEKELMPK